MFAEEMGEQPRALRDLIAYYRSGEGSRALDRAGELAGEARAATFTGMGSSLYASHAVLPALRAVGWSATPQEAGEALHYGLPGWKPEGLLVAVSQSGESAETRALAEALKGMAPTVAVTNEPGSGLAKAAGVVLPMRAGSEAAISTKTYTNTLGVLHLLKSALLREDRERALADLEAAARAMERALSPDMEDAVQRAAGWIDSAKSVHFIGRGPSLAAVYVGSLIVGEGARVTAVGLPAASFRHGPFELADSNHAALVFMPDGPTRPLMEKIRNDLLRVGSRAVSLTDSPGQNVSDGALQIVLGDVPSEAHFPFPAAILVERILAAVAARRGLTPGDFRYGEKVTAEE